MSPESALFVAARRSALTLRERLTVAAGASTGGRAATHRIGEADDDALRRWRRTLDPDGSGRFDRRLRWDDLREQEIRAAFRVAAEQTPVSDWGFLLDDACAVAGCELNEPDRAVDSGAPIPFEEVLLPFVEVARRRLRAHARSIDRILAPAAQASLERALLFELSRVAEQALLTDFSVARSLKGRSAVSLGCPSRTAYLEFVNALRASRLAPLVERYPVLLRLVTVRAGLWVSSVAELVSRAEADAPAIAALFGGVHLGPIVEVDTARGDTHCGGRAVATVRFASGLTIMYKPRSMKLDLAFYDLLNWLRERGLEPEQRVLRILDRDDYGWMEYIHPAPVGSDDELRDYYERAGALLCLSYVLGASDLHADNLIADGPYPVVVDMETMMSPAVQGANSKTPTADQPAPSVLRTLLLPFWNVGPKGRVFFHGGGLGLQHESLRSSEHVWSFVNTDGMSRERRTQPLLAPTNVPRLLDRLVPPTERTEDIVRGFNRCHAILERHRSELTAPGGPLHAFRGRRVRVLIRDTHVYGSVLRRSLHPRYLHDGFERSLELEVLRLSVLGSDERVGHWRAFEAEQRDLEDLDYPLFWAATDGTTLYDSRGAAVGTFTSVSAYDQVVDRLARLDANDRDHQSALIRFIYAYAVGSIATVRQSCDDAADAVAAGIDASTALAEARAIADALQALVVRDRDGSAQWVGVDRERSRASLELRRLQDRFYDGRAGIALFLAALDAVGATGHAELAAAALEPLRQMVRDPHKRDALANRIGLGAGFGLGGFIYALAQIGRLTDDARWIDDAGRAARALTRERIAADAILEVLGGAAGAALALLSLHDVTGEQWVLERAAACGRHLLDTAVDEGVTGRRVWRLARGDIGTGFAHGAGGIAAALLRLATATGNDAFAAAAAEGFGFEDALANAPRSETHPHLVAASAKVSAESPWRQTWCNGPVGVALGQAIYGGSVSPDVVAHASAHDIAASPDHPCCGSMGPAELLLVTGYPDRAKAIAGRVVARARAKESYHISRDVPEARTSPAFFQGLSGIGYQLLRITYGDRLRSALAFQ
jgi:type 2 lantibiotic biosynthesis protein LanM